MATAGQLMVEIGANVARLRSDMAQATQMVRGTADQMRSAMSSVGAALASGFAGFQAVQFARDIATTGLEVNRLSQAFANIKGSVGGASVELDYVRDLANRTGNDFMSLASGYKGIAAAAQGTSLEGEKVRSVFESIVKYSTALQLSSDQMGGALTAVSQIISKGVVSMEEMRQQLGERLPGAFQIAARAMNMTTGEFTEMASSGKLLATEFVPKFASELEKSAKNSENAAGAFNRLKNEWDNLKAGMWEGGGKTVLTTIADELARVVKLAAEAPMRLGIFGKTFANTLNLVDATKAANLFQRPETAESFAGIGAGVDAPRVVANEWKAAQEQAQAYWKTYREGAEKGIKEAQQLIESAQKNELSGLKDMLNEAMRLRKEHATDIQTFNKSIEQNRTSGADIITGLKRGQMSPEEQQSDIARESSKKLSEARFAVWGGQYEKAQSLAEQSRQAAQGMNDTTAAIQRVQEATRLLDRIYREQKNNAVTGFKDQEQAVASLKTQIDAVAAKPLQDMIDKAQAADLALKSAAATEFAIKGIPETVSALDELVRKLDEVKNKASEVQQYKITFKGEASPIKPLSKTISDIMGMLNALPTGSEYKMNFSYGLGSSIFGKSAYSEANTQYEDLMGMRNQVVSSLETLGMSAKSATEIFTEFTKQAWERLEYAGAVTLSGFEYVPAFRQANEYNLDVMKYSLSQQSGDFYDMIASALSDGSSSGYGGASMVSQSGGDVTIERAIDVGSIIVNLNGGAGGMDNARIVAEELDAQLADMVNSNRSKLRAALKSTWSN